MTRRSPLQPLRRARSGVVAAFTLMEVLIACGLLAIIGALLASSLSGAIDAKEIVEKSSDRYHLIRQAMTRMVEEISMAYVSAHNQAPELRVKTGFKGENDVLHFTAFGYTPRKEDAKQSDQQELSFFLGLDERTRTESIMRRFQPNPNDDFEEGGREQVLLPDVTDLRFEYWDARTEDWKEEWDIEEASFGGVLPQRVRITFVARMDEDGTEQTFTTQTKIWLWRPWAFRN